MEIAAFVELMRRDGVFSQTVNNPAAQFGSRARQYLGARYLPERPVRLLKYTERFIRFRSIVANDGTRYGPVQRKRGMLTGWAEVSVAHQDIGSEFTAQDYDTLLAMIDDFTGSRPPQAAVIAMIDWADTQLLVPLIEKIEVQRWQAMVSAQVVRAGDNGFAETVSYSNPTGHRVNIAAQWHDDLNDPMDDISDIVDFLSGKGFSVTDIVAGRPVISILQKNALMRDRVGKVTVAAGTVVGRPSRLTRTELNNVFSDEGLPPITEYNLQYQKAVGTDYFLSRTVMVFICATGQDATIDLGDAGQMVLNDVLGYVAVAPPAGQRDPGRRTVITPREKKPPGIDGQSWQATEPVIQWPEALAVLQNILPA